MEQETPADQDVDEPIDAWLHRPIAAILVAALRRTPITPNQVSVVSGLFGVAAGVCLGVAPTPLWLVGLGSAFLFLSVIFDCCDGHLARLRGETSMVGRALDGIVDAIVVVSIFVGCAVFLVRTGHDPLYVVLVAGAAGYSWRLQAEGFDFAKQLYLANTGAKPRSDTLPTLEEIEAERQRLLADGRPGTAFLLSGLKRYTEVQRKRRRGAVSGLERVMASREQRLLYKKMFKGYMRLWTWNGTGLHLFLTYVAGALSLLWPSAVFVVWWIMIVPLNLLLAIGRVWGFRLEDALWAKIERRGAD
jgi:hypothetical protein